MTGLRKIIGRRVGFGVKQSSSEYAMALFSLAEESREEKVYLDALEMLNAEISAQPDYLDYLSCPTVPKSERVAAVESAFGENVPPYVLSFLQILTEKNEAILLPACVVCYRELYNQKMGILPARVLSARALTESEKSSLRRALERKTKKQVVLTCECDPTLLGGLVVEIDGKRLDSSLRHRLNIVKGVMQE